MSVRTRWLVTCCLLVTLISSANTLLGHAGADPVIVLDSYQLTSSQTPDQVITQTLTISNTGGAQLSWTLTETEASGRSAAGLIWDQPVTGSSGNYSDFYNLEGSGVYSADDFKLTLNASIKVIQTDGYWTSGSLIDATAISWYIYPDNGGKPAGHPEDGLNLHVWEHSDDPAGLGISITNNNITLDVVQALGNPLNLGPGVYWLTVFPSINSATLDEEDRWNWSQADQQLTQAKMIDPGDLIGSGITDWTSFGGLGLPFTGTAFRLFGSVSGCTPANIPWLDASPTGGTVDPGSSESVTVIFDSTGLAFGEYAAALCLENNDPVNPLIEIPVTMMVEESAAIQISPASLSFSLPLGVQATTPLTITNPGVGDLDWEIFEDAQSAASQLGNWSEDFDSYSTGASLHGVGGWAGWGNNSNGTAFTTAAEALSNPNSVDVSWDVDLVQEFGATGGKAVFTAWQYIPSDFTGSSFFNVMNGYDPDDFNATNFSVMVNFSAGTGMLLNFGSSGGELPIVPDQWVEIRIEIDLSANTQSFYYNNSLLYSGTWTDEVSGDGALEIAGVNLFAFGSSTIYYDDLSLAHYCSTPGDASWLTAAPGSGTTPSGESDVVTVSVDTSGLWYGQTYQSSLCISSNDPSKPLIAVPVTLSVDDLGERIYLPSVFREP